MFSSSKTWHRPCFLGVEDKLTILKQLCHSLELELSQVAYAGDDINDLPLLQRVGCPLTVADAMPINRAQAIYVTQKSGGQGAVREICELLLASRSQQCEFKVVQAIA